jgi:hypothetical protein
MKVNEKRKVIHDKIGGVLFPSGYKLIKGQREYFVKKMGDSEMSIYIDYISTGKVRPGMAKVGYREENKVLALSNVPLTLTFTLEEFNALPVTGTLICPMHYKQYGRGVSSFKIKNEIELVEFADMLAKYLRESGLPFMEKYSNPFVGLKMMKEKKNGTKIPFESSCYVGLSSMYKGLAISKLCGDKEHGELLEEVTQVIDELNHRKEEWQESFVQFKEDLLKIDPIYKDMYENIW